MGEVKIFKTRTRVRYAETDAAGIVYYNNYFVYFELGRIELFRELKLPYTWQVPIAETYAKFHMSAEFDDPVEIHSFVAETRSMGFRIGCRVYRAREGEEPELLCEGYTSMVTVDGEKNPSPLPSEFVKAFEGISGTP
ncbi:MAG: acyl-CoA thioesterase [Planctomycetota bacterium]|jgi:acyl-CoA thioester hydrolase